MAKTCTAGLLVGKRGVLKPVQNGEGRRESYREHIRWVFLGLAGNFVAMTLTRSPIGNNTLSERPADGNQGKKAKLFFHGCDSPPREEMSKKM